MNDKLTTLTAVFLFFFALIYPLAHIYNLVNREIWMRKNKNRPRVVNKLLWNIAHSK